MYKEKILMTTDLGFTFCLMGTWTSFQLFSKATYRFLELIVPKTQIFLWSCPLTSSQIQTRSCQPMDHAPMKVNWSCCHITSEVIFCIIVKAISMYIFFLHYFPLKNRIFHFLAQSIFVDSFLHWRYLEAYRCESKQKNIVCYKKIH